MKRTVLGKTGIEAARLGFGGIPIQRLSEPEAIEIVLYALEKGMDFIDTSRAYSNSETRIGKALKETGRKAAVATKSFSRSSEGVRRDVEISLKELQLGYIDLYQCHGINSLEEYRAITASDGALAGLQRAREEGVIGHIGITSHSLDLLDTIIDDGLFETIMVCFSFMEPAAGDKVIPKALAQQIGVIAMKPLSGGVIDAPSAALKWALSRPEILVLAGVEDKKTIDQNWEVFQGGWQLTDDEKRQIDAIRRELDQKFCRRCDYCLPCQADIPIQYALGIRSMVRRMGPAMLQGPLFGRILETGANCTGCGDCMTRCPYNLPIPDMIRANLAWAREISGR